MQLTDVRAEKFGALSNVVTENLSPQMTVFCGPNGSGKTTFVKFLRGMFFGFRQNSGLNAEKSQSACGSVRIDTMSGPRVLRRSWLPTNTEHFSVSDDFHLLPASEQGWQLQNWVTEDVFREIFSAGHEEASQFALLTRLCTEQPPGAVPGSDLLKAESALQQVIRDRDGHGGEGEIGHRISELRRRQGDLQGKISQLRRPPADLQDRIEQLRQELDTAMRVIERVNLRTQHSDAELARLEKLLNELCHRNVLPLNRPELEEEIRVLSLRLDRWREIRELISREGAAGRVSGALALRPEEDVRSIRAIISRLEARAEALTERQQHAEVSHAELLHEPDVLRPLRSEITALCQYFGHHQQATARHIQSLQRMVADRTLTDAVQMERLLEEHLATLRTELSHADNVLADAVIPRSANDCRFSGHRQLIGEDSTGVIGAMTVTEVQTRLQQLRAERERLLPERSAAESSVAAKRAQLEHLRQDLALTASLEQVDELRAQIAQFDAEIEILEDQRRQLDRAEATFRELIQQLRSRPQLLVLDLASKYVQRITAGECHQISAADPSHLMIHVRHQSEPLSLSELSRGTRDQVALALRLALIQIRRPSYGHVPLILDDVFISSDDSRAVATVQLLAEVARQGQQILFLTCQREVCDLFARCGADVRNLSFNQQTVPPVLPVTPEPVFEIPVAVPVVSVAPVAAPAPVSALAPVAAAAPVAAVKQSLAAPPAAPLIEETPAPDLAPTNWLFYLEMHHGVEDLAGISLGELEALRAAGILTIDDMLQRNGAQLAEVIRQKGFLLSRERLESLRGQSELATCVPMLRRSDAALLFAAGIRSADELSRLRPETVYDRVTEFQRSEAGRHFRRGGRLIDRQQAMNWARFGQFTRSLDDARRFRKQFIAGESSDARRPAGDSTSAESAVLPMRSTSTVPQSLRRRRRRSDALRAEERRARRSARRERQISMIRESASDAAHAESREEERHGGMRFFLSRSSHVEKAPSIGPKTAAMLGASGIRTVEELLNMPADRLAEKLNHRRITVSIIQAWQSQSRLMCQVPELRGHDAQILVACGIFTPEGLAAQKAEELYSVVEPFTRTEAGERIIRSGRKPDLAEITNWIRWAANARSLKAA